MFLSSQLSILPTDLCYICIVYIHWQIDDDLINDTALPLHKVHKVPLKVHFSTFKGTYIRYL